MIHFSPFQIKNGLLAVLSFTLTVLGWTHHGMAQVNVTIDAFNGIRSGQFPGTNRIPPDISGAVGEKGILAVVNSAAAYYPKTGTATRTPEWNIPLEGPTSAFPASSTCFDPRAFYDAAEKRFFIIILEVNNLAQKSYLHIAASKNSHPQGKTDPADANKRIFDPVEWHRYRYDMTRTVGTYSVGDPGGADYPTLYVDGTSMIVTVNYFDIADAGGNSRFDGSLDEAGIFLFHKPSLLAGSGAAADGSAPPSVAPRTYFPSNTDGSIQPAVADFPVPSPSNAYFTSLDQDALDTFTDSYFIGYPGGEDDDQTDLDNLISPAPAPQPGGAATLDQHGDRMLGAVRDNNAIIGVFVSEADNESRSVIRVVRLRPGPGATTVERQYVLDAGPGLWNTLPAIAINQAGCLCVTWTASSSTQNPAIYCATSGPTKDFSSPRQLFQSATPYYGTGRAGDSYARWGDYALATIDPVDQTFWICQEFAFDASQNGWGTYWANIAPRPLPLIVQQPYVTTPQNASPQSGAMIYQAEVGAPIRTIKVCQGQAINLNTQITDAVGQNFLTAGLVLQWYFNDGQIPNSRNLATLPLAAIGLPYQGRYQARVTDACGVIKSTEEIYLDVVLPPAATINYTKLFLGPNSNGYFEVTPDAATVGEMDALTYTWNRNGNLLVLGGRGQVFVLGTAQHAADTEGVYSCTVTNICGSITLTGDLIAGPRITSQPTIQGLRAVCGQPIQIIVSGTGVRGSGAPGSLRPDFPPLVANYTWSNYTEGWHNVVWRKDGVPLTLGGRFNMTAPAFATTNTLTITNPDYEDEGIYDCVVTDMWGAARAVTSAPTRLLMEPLVPPFLTADITHGPDNRLGGGMAFDSRRGRMVLFGGEAYGINPRSPQFGVARHISNDTWEWDGQVWVKRNPATRPPGKTEFSMAYDSVRGRIVMFGGYEYTPPLFSFGTQQLSNSVWEWDGVDWRKITSTTTSPNARSNAAMCFDSERNEMLMIGGDNFTPIPPVTADYYAMINALWAWDGVKWTPRAGVPYPAAQISSGPQSPNAFVFDKLRKKAVMFGPFFDSTHPVWEWNGTGWNSILPPLPLRIKDSRYAKAFYDPYRAMVAIPIDANNFAYPTGADYGKSFLAYWTGTEFVRGEMTTINDIDGVLPTFSLGSPFTTQGDLCDYDSNRRCLVWLDTIDAIFNSGLSYRTREMHFSGKAKVVRQPTQVSIDSNGNITLSVIAAGLRPITWQWLKNGVPVLNNPTISGANAPSLVITGASTSDVGSYVLRITNGHNITETTPVILASTTTGVLNLSVSGENLLLTWSGSRVLETSTSLTGTWTVVANAISPYAVPMDEDRRFFRLR